jgi:hypothetical protein
MTKRLYAVINPAAGQPKPVLHTLNSVCGNAGVDWEVAVTKKSGDGQRFAKQALAAGVMAGLALLVGGLDTILLVVLIALVLAVPVVIDVIGGMRQGGRQSSTTIGAMWMRLLAAGCRVVLANNSVIPSIPSPLG